MNKEISQTQNINQPQIPNQNPDKWRIVHTFIAIILLLIVFPIGLIYMWLATSWSKGFKWFLTLFFPVVFLIATGFLLYSSSRHKSSEPQAPSNFLPTQFEKMGSFDKYTPTSFGIEFECPHGWQVYDRGAAISIQIMNCDAQSRDYCEHHMGEEGQLKISISNVGTKQADTSLNTYLKARNYIASETTIKKTSNGYDRIDASTRSSFISNGTTVLSISQESSSFGIDPKIADKIIDSIKFK